MPRYTREELGEIAKEIMKCRHAGRANEVYWWNMESSKKFLKRYIPDLYKVMSCPRSKVPLYTTHETDDSVPAIALWRLAHNK